MNKKLKFIIDKRYYIYISIVMIFLFLQMRNVNMYADDYFIINNFRFIERNFDNVCKIFSTCICDNFNVWSGRLIGHCLVNLVLICNDITIYKILNPIIILLFCFIIAKIINYDNRYKTEKIVFGILIILLRYAYIYV